MENLQQSIMNFVLIVLSGAITIASIYAGMYVRKAVNIAKAKAEQDIKDEDAKNKVNNTLDKMNDLIQTGITALENTTKKDILNDIALGKCDKSALDQLAVDVKDNVLKQLGDGGVQILNGVVDDVNDYVSKKIEATLADLKVNPNSSVSKTVVPEVSKDVVELQNKLSETQTEKDNLTQQLSQASNDKANVEQSYNQLTVQNQQLTQQVQELTNKLSTIQNAIANTNVNNNVTVDNAVVNGNDTTGFVNAPVYANQTLIQ